MKRDNSKIIKRLKKVYKTGFKKYYESFTEFLKCKWVKMFKRTPNSYTCKTERLIKKLENRKLRYSEKQQIKDGIEEYNLPSYTCGKCELFHKNICYKESVRSEDTICKDFRD